MKIPFKQIAKNLTGFSTPIFGVSWNPPKTERAIVRKLLIFLEDRRVLYVPYDFEMPAYVDQSIIEIRKRLTDDLELLDEKSEISGHLRAMRAACRKFLAQPAKRYLRMHNEEFFAALGELRAIFGIHIGQLAVKYGIDLEQELVAILPIPDSKK